VKIIFLSFSDYKGGASIAAYSIFKSLRKKNALFLTVYKKFKSSTEIYSFLKKVYIFNLRVLEKILIYFFSKKKFHQSLNIFNTYTQEKISKLSPDLINIHWINRSMISLKELISFKQKIVVSLHDMWFINSTEHYFIKKRKENFLSKYCLNQKKKFLYKDNVYFITHNNWMYNKLIQLHPKLKKKIFISKYYPINTNLFKPRNKKKLRIKYKIPINKKVVLFSAQDIKDERKGFKYFCKILKILSKDDKFYFITIGKNKPKLENFKNYRHVEFLINKKTSDFYSLSDIYMCNSMIDNLPLTILEALSSGNLVISFKNGGAEELLKKVGYTFKTSEINKIIKLLKKIDNNLINKKSKLARKFALKNFSYENSKKNYLKIFDKVLKKKN
tara:strand:+ start:973 stop:2136 length:1164 start_codon:yes stop_codon:yes gene_type:complete